MASKVSYQFILIQISNCTCIFPLKADYRSFCHRPVFTSKQGLPHSGLWPQQRFEVSGIILCAFEQPQTKVTTIKWKMTSNLPIPGNWLICENPPNLTQTGLQTLLSATAFEIIQILKAHKISVYMTYYTTIQTFYRSFGSTLNIIPEMPGAPCRPYNTLNNFKEF